MKNLRFRCRRAACRAVGLALGLVLTGCGNLPSQPMPDATDDPPVWHVPFGDSVAAFEAAQRHRAQALQRQGKLGEAAWVWEVLTVLRPGNDEYRNSLAAVKRQIDLAVAERLQRAQQAQKRGDWEAATTHYLTVLSLQPEHEEAADALRSIERERNRRHYLGKPSRITLARRGPERRARLGADHARGTSLPRQLQLEPQRPWAMP